MKPAFPVLIIRYDKISKWDSSVEHTISLLHDLLYEEGQYGYDYREFDSSVERKAYLLALENEPDQDSLVVYVDRSDIERLDDALELGIYNGRPHAIREHDPAQAVESFAEHIRRQADAIRAEARNAIAGILRDLPSNALVSDDCLGYIHYENMGGEFVEASLHAMRLDGNGTVTVTTDVDYDEQDNPVVNDWDDPAREMTFSEDDHYSTIDWVTTIQCVADHLKNHPEILTPNKPQDK